MSDEFRGDPDGYRFARRRAQRLDEAGRVVRLLDVLLQEAHVSDTEIPGVMDKLAALVSREEARSLQQGYGRIEPRKRFKEGRKVSLRDRARFSVLHVDECGQGAAYRPGGQPFLVLGAVAMGEAEITRYVERVDEFKQQMFGRTDITLHEPDMRNRQGEFYFEGDRGRQAEFDEGLPQSLAKQTSWHSRRAFGRSSSRMSL